MKVRDIKTIDVLTKCWFDKINGNSYFAQRIVINRGKKNEVTIYNHFQYGYSSYDYFAKQCVRESLNLKTDLNKDYSLCGYRGKILFNNDVIKNCKKRDLIHIEEI